MGRNTGAGVLSWIQGGLDSIVLGLTANAFGIAIGSRLVDKLQLESPVTSAVAGGLTALALVPVNYSIAHIAKITSDHTPRKAVLRYARTAALLSAVLGAGYFLLREIPEKEEIIRTFIPSSLLPYQIPSLELGLFDIYRRYQKPIMEASREYSIPVSLIVANIYVESRGDPRAVSCTGAAGLMQLTVDTATEVGVKPGNYELIRNPGYVCDSRSDWPSTREACNKIDTSRCDYVNDQRFAPDQNIRGGTRNLRFKFKARGNWYQALNDNAGGRDPTYYSRVWSLKSQFETGDSGSTR